MKGKIHGKEALFFRNDVGTAKADGFSFELTTHFGQSTPIVRCEETGKWFTLSWEDIVNAVIAAGTTKPEQPKRRKAVKP